MIKLFDGRKSAPDSHFGINFLIEARRREIYCCHNDGTFILSSDMMHSVIGQIGEDCAATYIRERGWKILGRNVRLHTGELDIVAQEGATIIFVEVKAQKKDYGGFLKPEDHLDRRKERKLRAVSREYLIANRYPEHTLWRIDLAAVVVNNESRKAQVRYYQNVVAETA